MSNFVRGAGAAAVVFGGAAIGMHHAGWMNASFNADKAKKDINQRVERLEHVELPALLREIAHAVDPSVNTQKTTEDKPAGSKE